MGKIKSDESWPVVEKILKKYFRICKELLTRII